MFVIKYKKIFFAISTFFVGFALFSAFFGGLNLGIEFTGGAITEVRYTQERPTIEVVQGALAGLPLGSVLVQPTGDNGYIIRVQELDGENRAAFLGALSIGDTYGVVEERFNLIGPSIGEELRKKAWVAIALVIFGIILFVAFVFRGISENKVLNQTTGITAWHYGTVAIVALAHDIIIPTGIFAFLGSVFIDAQIDVLFVTALLAILGYSVNDTIVVFDRVRENLKLNWEMKVKKTFAETVGVSLQQTYTRSINTSLTTLFVLLALFFIGGATTQNFVLVLAIGVVAGTYSSIFLATPLLVMLSERKMKKE